MDNAIVIAVGVVAGAVSAVTGFGIGSLLTPVLALSIDTRVAVAAVSIPHVVGTAVRFWLLQGGIDRRVLWSFGLTSAGGGLAGAALYSVATNRWLNLVFGVLLLFAAVSEVTGLARRMRFRGWVAWLAGAPQRIGSNTAFANLEVVQTQTFGDESISYTLSTADGQSAYRGVLLRVGAIVIAIDVIAPQLPSATAVEALAQVQAACLIAGGCADPLPVPEDLN